MEESVCLSTSLW